MAEKSQISQIPSSATNTTGNATRENEDTSQIPLGPVLWAVDAYPEEADLHRRTAMIIENVFPDTPIHPVYVLSEESFTDRGFSDFLSPSLKPMALRALTSLLSEIGLPEFQKNLRKPRVLVEGSASLAACAHRLLRYAKRIGAGRIVLGSHGKRPLARFLVGSFSEVILDHSPVPILIAGPKTVSLSTTPNLIVFPTDFSPICQHAYTEVLYLAKALKAQIHLFHKTMSTMDPFLQGGVQIFGGGWVSVEPYMFEPPKDHESEADTWIKRAELEGVTAHYINENFGEPTSDAIVKYLRNLKETSSLLAMVSQTGPVASALLGSITREVIRESPSPVYLTPRPH